MVRSPVAGADRNETKESPPAVSQPRVSVVVVPRERFSLAEESLDSLLAKTRHPHQLIYVASGAPPALIARLKARAREHSFQLLADDPACSPNAARNLGLARVTTEYVVFVDNDVSFARGWLGRLVACADETGAEIVSPLVLIGKHREGVVHLCGGEIRIEERDGRRLLAERHRNINRRLDELGPLQRERCDFAEFHCVLVRRSVFERIGPLDEELLSTAEHLDLALSVQQGGGEVWFEPGSVITYRTDGPFTFRELEFFRRRWSKDWNRRSFEHFARKWNLDRESPIFHGNGAFLQEHQRLVSLPDPQRARPRAEITLHRHGYAQTPAQLLHQVQEAGWPAEELTRVKQACDLAVVLYSGLFRACGKPFLCHAIGTASILVRHGAPPTLALAGLHHAALTHGHFGDGAPASSEAHRLRLRHTLGKSVELHVTHYKRFRWSEPVEPGEIDFADYDCRSAAVCVIRMANNIEERLDGALALTAKKIDTLPGWAPFFTRLCAFLSIPELGREYRLVHTLSAAAAESMPATLQHQSDRSFAIAEGDRTHQHFRYAGPVANPDSGSGHGPGRLTRRLARSIRRLTGGDPGGDSQSTRH